MYLYQKTFKPKNTAGKITALLCLLGGALLFILANGHIPLPLLAQIAGVILICTSIYIASAYLLREYTFSVTQGKNYNDEEAEYSEKFDFIITEKKNNRDIKVCHFIMSDITAVREVSPENKKQVQAERKSKKRYTYNTQYAASRLIEVAATMDDENYSILITYDEDLLRVMNDLIK